MAQTSPPEDAQPTSKWGDAAIAGWQALPDVLLKNQKTLGLSPTELVVLINVLSFWWYVDRPPYPRASTLAKRMDVNNRTVYRALDTLTKKRLIAKKPLVEANGVRRDTLDMQGLVAALSGLAKADPAFHHRKRIQEG